MKNLFNDISQDEKNRILEMHSAKKNIISEQGLGLTSGIGRPLNGMGGKPTTTPVKPTPTKQPISLEGKTINLYYDKGEKELLGTFKMSKPSTPPGTNNGVKIPVVNISQNDEKTTGQKQIYFHCSYLDYGNDVVGVMLKVQNGKIDGKESITVYNSKIVKNLINQYCAVSRGGSSVPKADFAMNNQSTDTTTGIA
jgi:hypothetical protein